MSRHREPWTWRRVRRGLRSLAWGLAALLVFPIGITLVSAVEQGLISAWIGVPGVLVCGYGCLVLAEYADN